MRVTRHTEAPEREKNRLVIWLGSKVILGVGVFALTVNGGATFLHV